MQQKFHLLTGSDFDPYLTIYMKEIQDNTVAEKTLSALLKLNKQEKLHCPEYTPYRDFCLSVDELREAGAPVIGNPRCGVFLATSVQEVKHYINYLQESAGRAQKRAEWLANTIS